MPALLQLILQTLQSLGDRKITREMVKDSRQESSAFTFIRYMDTIAIQTIGWSRFLTWTAFN